MEFINIEINGDKYGEEHIAQAHCHDCFVLKSTNIQRLINQLIEIKKSYL